MTELSEVFADPILSSERVSRRELQDLITAAPSAARSMLNLFQAYRKVREQLEFSSGDGRQAGGVNSPVEQVGETLQQANNFLPKLRRPHRPCARRWPAVMAVIQPTGCWKV